MIIITENDLDGEALISALEHGPEALKEAIPSLDKRLKLNWVLKTIQQDQQVIYVYLVKQTCSLCFLVFVRLRHQHLLDPPPLRVIAF